MTQFDDDTEPQKQHFTYEGKTGIAETKGFQKKQLADFACNIGNICEFGCTFCYVPTVTTRQKYVQKILKKGFSPNQVSLYRTKDNILKCVGRDLKKHKKGDGDERVVFFCTTCDPCPTDEHAQITIEAIKLIMENSDLYVRVLSKSKLIVELAKALDPWRERIIYGLSTGTCRPEISACIESNATPVKERTKALGVLQDISCRTYGMLCPILPSEMDCLGQLIDAINPEKCEHIWAEPINVRGKSLVKTYNQLKQCDLEKDAEKLNAVMGNKERWRDYSKELFTTLRHELEKKKVADKLRFLQYVKREPKEFVQFFESQQGALCL
jgi:DNA repair photolyase